MVYKILETKLKKNTKKRGSEQRNDGRRKMERQINMKANIDPFERHDAKICP